MEKSEEFKRVVANIKQLELKLVLIEEKAKINEQFGMNTESEIEEYFEKCLNALAVRKEALLRDLEKEIGIQRRATEAAQKAIINAIEVQRKVLEAGSVIYKTSSTAAEQVWKEAGNMSIPQASITGIKVDLSTSLLNAIQIHGKVVPLNAGTIESVTPSFSFTAEYTTTFAGSERGFTDGRGEKAQFNLPHGICWNPNDNCLYLCDKGNNAIRKITLQGEVNTFVKEGELSGPHGIVVHHKTNIFYVTNQRSHTVVEISASGTACVLAGSGKSGYQDGIGTDASFYNPTGIALDQQTGSLFVSDSHNNSIRSITLQGQVSTLAVAMDREISPWGICFDEIDESLLICDHNNHKLRRISLDGNVSTVCDIPSPAFVTISHKFILVTSLYEFKLFKVSRTGEVSVLEQKGKESGKTEECKFYKPSGLVVHEPTRSCFVVESSAVTPTIRKISFST